MKYFFNNSTTYNYSQYATRPKWLTFFLVKNTFPYLLKNQKGQQGLTQYSFTLNKKNQKKIKLQKESVLKHYVKTKPFLKKKHNVSKIKRHKFFEEKSSIKNTNIYRIKTKYLFLGGQKKQKKRTHKQTNLILKGLYNSYRTHINLFKTKELLCWTSDLSFFNLRGYFLNILKALQICRFAARNNKKILFIKGNHFNEDHSRQLNSWLAQYRRQTIPLKLCGILKMSWKKSVFGEELHKKVNYFKTKKPKITKNKILVSYQQFYLINGLLNSSIKVKSMSAEDNSNHNNNNKKNPFISNVIERHETQSFFTLKNIFRRKILINNIIKIWIKEAQVIAQLPATGLAIPLKGFLTNSKTAFYTVYNTVYSDLYNRTYLGKTTNVTNNCCLESLPKVQINRLEKINHLYQGKIQIKSQTKNYKDVLLFSGLKKQSFFLFKNFKKESHALKVPLINVVKNSLYLLQQKKQQIKNKKKKNLLFDNSKRSFSNMRTRLVIPPINPFTLYWRKYSNKGVAYLPLTTKNNTILNKHTFLINSPFTQFSKIKKQQLEYPFCGNLLTWQFNNFYLAQYVSNQQKKEKKLLITNFIKQQKILLDRLAIQFNEHSTFFGFLKIKQLQSFNNRLFTKKKRIFTKQLNIKIKVAFFKETLKTIKLGLMTSRCIVPKDTSTFLLSKHFNPVVLNKRQHTKFILKNTVHKKRLNKSSKISFKNYYKYNCIFTYGYLKQTKSKKTFYNKTLKLKNKKNKILVRKLCSTVTLFNKYYKTIKALNQFKQYEMFVKTPFVNNRLADIIFFINPEKNQNLVNQANNLKIPTIGIVSGITVCKAQVKSHFRGKHKHKPELFKDSVYFPILGNPTSDFFTRTILSLFVKALYNRPSTLQVTDNINN